MQKIAEHAAEVGMAYAPNVLGALVIFFAGWIAARIVRHVLRGVLLRSKLDAGLVGFISSASYAALFTFVVLAALGRLGVQTTSFAAVIAAAGLAVGFALQGSLANLAAGVMILVFRPFKVGDYVEAGGTAGIVEELQIFATTLTTPDNKHVVVPNSAITGGNIVNYSSKPQRRVDLVFGIGYGDDLKKAKTILQELLDADERILKTPAPTIAVLELGESSVNFAVRPWVKTADYWPVHFDLTERVKLAFDEKGISIPFPQTDVHLHQVPGGKAA